MSSSDSLDIHLNQNEKLLNIDCGDKSIDKPPPSSSSYLNYQSIQNHNKKMDLKQERESLHLVSIEHNNTMSQISSMTHNFTESIENENFTKLMKRGSFKGTTKRHDRAFEYQETLNVTNENLNCGSVIEIKSRKTSEKKRSLPNIIFRNHRQSLDILPIVLKKKFSLGSIKVRLCILSY